MSLPWVHERCRATPSCVYISDKYQEDAPLHSSLSETRTHASRTGPPAIFSTVPLTRLHCCLCYCLRGVFIYSVLKSSVSLLVLYTTQLFLSCSVYETNLWKYRFFKLSSYGEAVIIMKFKEQKRKKKHIDAFTKPKK